MQTSTTLVFEVQYEYMLGAFALMLLSVVSICYILKGWWVLGRDVSMSPLEIAKAFNAPFLKSNESSNAEIKRLLKDIGERRVKYGEVRLEMSSVEQESATTTKALKRLEMNHPDTVQGPSPSF